MATKYRLPCHGDAFVAVDASQAGLSITCPCGEQVQVPTWRELSRLERLEAEPATGQAARRRSDDSSNWTPQKGLIFLGLVILVFSSALAGIFGMSMPSEQPIHVNYDSIRERANALSLNDSMKEWHDLRGGLRKDELNSMVRFRAIQESYRRWVYISIGGCVIGALLCIIGVATSGMSLRVPQ